MSSASKGRASVAINATTATSVSSLAEELSNPGATSQQTTLRPGKSSKSKKSVGFAGGVGADDGERDVGEGESADDGIAREELEAARKEISRVIPKDAEYLGSERNGCEGLYLRVFDGESNHLLAEATKQTCTWIHPISLDDNGRLLWSDAQTPENEVERTRASTAWRDKMNGVVVQRGPGKEVTWICYRVPPLQLKHSAVQDLPQRERVMREGVIAWIDSDLCYLNVPKELLDALLIVGPHRIRPKGALILLPPVPGTLYVWCKAETGGAPAGWEDVGEMGAGPVGKEPDFMLRVFKQDVDGRLEDFKGNRQGIRIEVQERFVGGCAFRRREVEEEQRQEPVVEVVFQRQLTPEEIEEEEDLQELTQDDYAQLDNLLKKKHRQKYDLPGRDLRADKSLDDKVRERMNPLLFLNAQLIQTERIRDFRYERSRDPQVMPHHYVVTGHSYAGGNVGINGIYERYPSDYEGKPVYCKTLEKRAAPVGGSGSPAPLPRLTHPLMVGERFELARSQTAFKAAVFCECGNRFTADVVSCRRCGEPRLGAQVAKPQRVKSEAALIAFTGNVYFMYFRSNLSAWCIGPEVGNHACFARHASAEEAIPFMMSAWEVWDCGQHCWRESRGMRVYKCGTVRQEPKEQIMRCLPPDWPTARLKNDQW